MVFAMLEVLDVFRGSRIPRTESEKPNRDSLNPSNLLNLENRLNLLNLLNPENL